MKIKKRILSLALAGTMALGLMPGMNTTALAATGDTSYTLTIPSTLNVANSGWNATDGISATGTLASGKKLTVTASSANSWALKSGSNSVGYKMATASADTKATKSWEFTELSNTATTKPMGIIVDDYSAKPAGTYQDTVTFTAKVESAKPEYYDKLVECGCDDLDGKCYNGANPENGFTGQVLSAAQAIALAQAKAAETSSNCAVFYDNGSRFAEIAFAKNDGTTGSARFYFRPDDKGLTGYRGFYVSK